jgi:hypothetical protein
LPGADGFTAKCELFQLPGTVQMVSTARYSTDGFNCQVQYRWFQLLGAVFHYQVQYRWFQLLGTVQMVSTARYSTDGFNCQVQYRWFQLPGTVQMVSTVRVQMVSTARCSVSLPGRDFFSCRTARVKMLGRNRSIYHAVKFA